MEKTKEVIPTIPQMCMKETETSQMEWWLHFHSEIKSHTIQLYNVLRAFVD